MDDYYSYESEPRTVLNRLRISAPDDPGLTRVLDVPEDAPLEWVATAYRLATGRDDLVYIDDEHLRETAWRYGEVSTADHAPPPEFERAHSYKMVYGLHSDREEPHRVELLRSQPALPGDRYISLVTEPDAGEEYGGHEARTADRFGWLDKSVGALEHAGEGAQAGSSETTQHRTRISGDWRSERAPFRPEHVQHELELAFGRVPAPPSLSDMMTQGCSLSSGSPLIDLAARLRPARRLAFRAHIEDAGLTRPPQFDEETTRVLTAGLRWCLERLGAEGLPQGEDGWTSEDERLLAAQALEWPVEHGEHDVQDSGCDDSPGRPASPQRSESSRQSEAGDALWALIRSLRLARRYQGRVVATRAGRETLEHPARILNNLARELWWGGDRRSPTRSTPTSRTLALLALADGTADDISTLAKAAAPSDPLDRDEYGSQPDYSSRFARSNRQSREHLTGRLNEQRQEDQRREEQTQKEQRPTKQRREEQKPEERPVAARSTTWSELADRYGVEATMAARDLMDVLSPLGGIGFYGAVTPGIRRIAHAALL